MTKCSFKNCKNDMSRTLKKDGVSYLVTCISKSIFQDIDIEKPTNYSEFYEPLFNDEGYPMLGDIPMLNRKIFKGIRVSIIEHPYVVSIRRQYSHYTTGALISMNLIATVAHPLIDVPIQELGIVVGENYSDRGTSVLTVLLVVIHEHFDPSTLRADLALMRIYEDQVYRHSVKPIVLTSNYDIIDNNKAFVTGWGRCDFTGKELCLPRSSRYFPDEILDPMLRSISFTVNTPNLYCDGYERHGLRLRRGTLCLGIAREDNPVTSCLAVPGAPLVVRGRLAGLQSWGFGCGFSHDLPLIYTRIAFYQLWILHNMAIMQNISRVNLTNLFTAIRSDVMLQWFALTRENMPRKDDHSHDDIEMNALDRVLLNLKGNVYDIRNYLDKEKFLKAKNNFNEAIKIKLIKAAKIKSISESLKVHQYSPFLNKDAVNEALNTSSNDYELKEDYTSERFTNYSTYEQSTVVDEDSEGSEIIGNGNY